MTSRRNWNSRSSLMIAAWLSFAMVFASCSKDDEVPSKSGAAAKEESPKVKAKGSDKADAPTPTPSIEILPVPRPPKAAPGDVMKGPEGVTLVGAYQNAKHSMRVAVVFESLVSSALFEPLMGYIPPEAKAKYDRFVALSGVNPAERFEGVVMLAHAQDVSKGSPFKDKTSEATMLFFLTGAVDSKMVEAFKTLKDEKEDKPDKDKDSAMHAGAFFVTVTPEVLLEFKTEGEAKAGKPREEGAHSFIALDDSHFMGTKETKDEREFVYMWPGGLLMGDIPASDKPIDEAGKDAIAKFIGDLGQLSGEGSGKLPFLSVEVPMNNEKALVDMSIGADNIVVNASVPLPPEDFKKIGGLVLALPELKKDPAKLLGDKVPKAWMPLAVLAIGGTELSLKDPRVIGTVTLPTAQVKAALPASLQ